MTAYLKQIDMTTDILLTSCLFSLKNISVSHMFNRGNYIFNPNFQKGTSSTKKTNFGIIQEPDQLLFRRDFFLFPLYFFSNFYRQISIEKRRSPY